MTGDKFVWNDGDVQIVKPSSSEESGHASEQGNPAPSGGGQGPAA